MNKFSSMVPALNNSQPALKRYKKKIIVQLNKKTNNERKRNTNKLMKL